MKIIKRSELLVPTDRQRSEIDKGPLADLQDSILALGLMSPPICHWSATEQQYQLVAGRRRLAALDQIAADGIMFRCHDQLVLPGEVPIVLLTELNAAQLFQAELEENIIREQLDWQDRVRAIAKLHELRKADNPTQSINQTAMELARREGAALQSEPPLRAGNAPKVRAPSRIRTALAEAAVVAPHLDDPAISKARNEREAYQLVLKRESARFEAELLRRRGIAASTLDCTIRCGDALKLLPELPSGQFDLILTDPPYGIGVDRGAFRARTVHHHNYADTEENAHALLKAILSEGWRLCKPKANLLIFTDIKHWPFLKQFSAQQGWTAWPWPVIWQKSEHEGQLGGWGAQGFIRTYEMLFFATKGARGLNQPELDIITEKRVARNKRIHGAEKPVALMAHYIDITTVPGDWVLDPCVGSGTTVVAAKQHRRHALGIELDRPTADEALVRLSKVGEPGEPSEPPDEPPLPDLLTEQPAEEQLDAEEV